MAQPAGRKRGPYVFHCARVHRGEYRSGGDVRSRAVRHDFKILHGEATIKPGRSVVVANDDGRGSSSILETYYIFPMSDYVRVLLNEGREEKTMNLMREEDRTKSRMYKQRLATRRLGFAPESATESRMGTEANCPSDRIDTDRTERNELLSLRANDAPSRSTERTPPAPCPAVPATGLHIRKKCCRCGKPVGILWNSFTYPGKVKGSVELTDAQPICQSCLDQRDDYTHAGELANVWTCLRENDFDRAVEIIKSFFNKNNEYHHYNLGHIYFSRGWLRDAMECFDNALLLNTHYIKAWYWKGHIFKNQGEFAEAAICFNNIRTLDLRNESGWRPASDFCGMISLISLFNASVRNGTANARTQDVIHRMLAESKEPVWQFASSKGYNIMELDVDDYVDFCFKNQWEILNFLEPLKPGEVNINIHSEKWSISGGISRD